MACRRRCIPGVRSSRQEPFYIRSEARLPAEIHREMQAGAADFGHRVDQLREWRSSRERVVVALGVVWRRQRGSVVVVERARQLRRAEAGGVMTMSRAVVAGADPMRSSFATRPPSPALHGEHGAVVRRRRAGPAAWRGCHAGRRRGRSGDAIEVRFHRHRPIAADHREAATPLARPCR